MDSFLRDHSHAAEPAAGMVDHPFQKNVPGQPNESAASAVGISGLENREKRTRAVELIRQGIQGQFFPAGSYHLPATRLRAGVPHGEQHRCFVC